VTSFAKRLRVARTLARPPHRRRLPLRLGERLIQHAASDRVPCGCSSHRHAGIDAVEIAWRAAGDEFSLRCLVCSSTWTRPASDEARADLGIDAS